MHPETPSQQIEKLQRSTVQIRQGVQSMTTLYDKATYIVNNQKDKSY